jgi:hypothetical protein
VLPQDDPRRARAKTELLEAFAPRDPSWRQRVVTDALALVTRSVQALRV